MTTITLPPEATIELRIDPYYVGYLLLANRLLNQLAPTITDPQDRLRVLSAAAITYQIAHVGMMKLQPEPGDKGPNREHTVLDGSGLRCLGCGQVRAITAPLPLNVLINLSVAFELQHRECLKRSELC